MFLGLGGLSWSAGLTGPFLLLASIAALFSFGLREQWASDRSASAYSVFNEGGARLQGTFTAEQFDAQLRGGRAQAETGGTPVRRAVPAEDSATRISDMDRVRMRAAAASAAARRAAQQVD